MNLRDLRYLVALADHKHFGRAAAASFVSQPTLSTQIRKLEDELGVALVERAPRKVMLTPVGRDIAERARRIVARGRTDARSRAAHRRIPKPAPCGSACSRRSAPYLLPHVVPGIRARFPRLELLLVEEKSDVILSRLREGRLDAGLLALPIHDDQLHVEFLFEEPFLLAVPESHPLRAARLAVDEGPRRPAPAAARGRPLPARPGARRLPAGRRRRDATASGRPAWKRCGRWSPRTSASRCCRRSR